MDLDTTPPAWMLAVATLMDTSLLPPMAAQDSDVAVRTEATILLIWSRRGGIRSAEISGASFRTGGVSLHRGPPPSTVLFQEAGAGVLHQGAGWIIPGGSPKRIDQAKDEEGGGGARIGQGREVGGLYGSRPRPRP